jgi:NAD-dependent deacetylase
MQVYPAAGLVAYLPLHCNIIYIDPKPHINHELRMSKHLTVIAEPATTGVRKVVDQLIG